MKPKPGYVARVHRSICSEKNCPYLDKIDYLDPCAACPEGHWGQYSSIGCSDNNGNRLGSSPMDLSRLMYPPTPGAGTELKLLLAKFGLKPAAGCKCAKHITEMNAKGIEWCSENIPTIVGWLKEEAHRAKLPFFETGARIIVKRSISNARKKEIK